MPELPEVEVIRRGLLPLVCGRRITAVTHAGKLRLPFPRQAMESLVSGRRIVAIERRAKYLLLVLDSRAALVVHLGMSGRIQVMEASRPPRPHDHVRFRLDNGTEIRLHDPRRFGSVQVLAPSAEGPRAAVLFKDMGPEPLEGAFSADYLERQAAGRRRAVKIFLMDGHVVAGIGNIYASEILFAAGIAPQTPVAVLGGRDWAKIYAACQQVLTAAIACGGSSISDFTDPQGHAGYFQNNFSVYGRAGEPCRHCGTAVLRTVTAGRSSFFCPRCQPAPPQAGE